MNAPRTSREISRTIRFEVDRERMLTGSDDRGIRLACINVAHKHRANPAAVKALYADEVRRGKVALAA